MNSLNDPKLIISSCYLTLSRIKFREKIIKIFRRCWRIIEDLVITSGSSLYSRSGIRGDRIESAIKDGWRKTRMSLETQQLNEETPHEECFKMAPSAIFAIFFVPPSILPPFLILSFSPFSTCTLTSTSTRPPSFRLTSPITYIRRCIRETSRKEFPS